MSLVSSIAGGNKTSKQVCCASEVLEDPLGEHGPLPEEVKADCFGPVGSCFRVGFRAQGLGVAGSLAQRAPIKPV